MGGFSSDDHYIYYCRQESVRRNGVVLIINKRRGSKALSKDKHAHKQRSCSLFGGLLLIDCPFQSPNETITSEKYAQQINEMHQNLQCLQPTLVNRKGPILCHNAQQHVAQPTFQKLNKLSYKVLPHTPYSPDLSPTDYHFSSILTSF